MLSPDQRPRRDGLPPAPGRDLREYWSIVYRWRHVVAAITLLALGLAGWRALRARPVYAASVQLMVGRLVPQVLEFKEVMQVDAQNWGDEYHLTQLKLIESRSLARRVVEKLGLAQDPEFSTARSATGPPPLERVVDAFLNRVDARRIEHSQFIKVTFEAGRPELAAQAANTLADLFIEDAVRTRAETVAQASSWLAVQIDEERGKVAAAQDALRRLSQETGIVNFEERRALLDQKLKLLGTHLTEGQARRVEKEALYREMLSVADAQDLSTVIGSRTFQEMRMDLSRLEQRESELLGSRHLDQHPEVVKVRAEIAQARSKVAAEAAHIVKASENDYLAAQAQERELARAVEEAKAEALDLNRRGLRYEALKRDLDAGQAVLNSLLTRSKQTDVAQELRASPIRVVDRAAVPTDPIGPRRKRDLAVALFLGLTAGVGTALLLDALDPRIKTPRDVGRLGVPLLAVVPEARPRPAHPLLFDGDGLGDFTDGYRVLRAALDHLASVSKAQVVSFVSTQPREGKTVCAVNLALALASREDAVVLIDGDLRRPEVEQLLDGAHRTPGLTDVLADRVESSAAVQELAGTSLKLVASGSPSSTPADALRPEALGRLLDALRARFRWVVIDTSPLGVVPDALSLIAASDGVVLVVAAEATHGRAAAQTLAHLDQLGCRVLGVVLNRARVDHYPYEYGAGLGGYAAHAADTRGTALATAK